MNFSATTEKASAYTSEIVHLLHRPTATKSAFRAHECRGGQLSFAERAGALDERAHKRHLVSCQHDERARKMSGGA